MARYNGLVGSEGWGGREVKRQEPGYRGWNYGDPIPTSGYLEEVAEDEGLPVAPVRGGGNMALTEGVTVDSALAAREQAAMRPAAAAEGTAVGVPRFMPREGRMVLDMPDGSEVPGVLVSPAGGGEMVVPAANLMPGATWGRYPYAEGTGEALEYGLRADLPVAPVRAGEFTAPGGAWGVAGDETVRYQNVGGNVIGGRVAAPTAPRESVIERLEAQAREGMLERRGIEAGLASGGATSVRDKAVAREIGVRREAERRERAAEAAAERRRQQPQAVGSPAGLAMWDGNEWRTDMAPVAPVAPKPEPHWTEQVNKLTGLLKQATGSDVGMEQLMAIGMLTNEQDKMAALARLGVGDPELMRYAMGALKAVFEGAGVAQQVPEPDQGAVEEPAVVAVKEEPKKSGLLDKYRRK